jgi:hypothetical protein
LIVFSLMSGGFFSGADWIRQSLLLAGLWCAAAVILIIANGPEHLSHKHRKQTLMPYPANLVTEKAVAKRP